MIQYNYKNHLGNVTEFMEIAIKPLSTISIDLNISSTNVTIEGY